MLHIAMHQSALYNWFVCSTSNICFFAVCQESCSVWLGEVKIAIYAFLDGGALPNLKLLSPDSKMVLLVFQVFSVEGQKNLKQ